MKLIFVYNADSGFVSSMLDIGHKIVNPETYSCNLCQMTFDTFTENKKWKEFREGSHVEMEFLHRDEFEKKYNMKLDYPVVLKEAAPLETAISPKELDAFTSLDELINAVKNIQ
ncbi:MAG: GTPase [Desulfobulbaceae bacterium]|uniref:GTPase n=1 Tax=Candidatus Desulfobia pelagia TaxID=2841692 RepID=A0A8J6NC06_9BACT|nr:GTPase [Candidatus Desulfobia pelagia]